MQQTNDHSTPDYPLTIPRRRNRFCWPPIPGAIITGLCVAWSSKDPCCTTFSSSVFAALIIWAIDRNIIQRVTNTPTQTNAARLLLIVAVAASFSLIHKVDNNHVFTRCFEIQPPPGIEDMEVDSKFMGNLDQTILFRFTADQQTIEEITKHPDFAIDKESLNLYRDGSQTWQDAWIRMFGGFSHHGGEAWQPPPPMQRPHLYRWDREDQGVPEQTMLLWNEQTHRAYVMYNFG